jgi:hypothetical protein
MAKLGMDRGRTRMGIGEASAGTASDARNGVARVMQPGIYSTGVNILRDLIAWIRRTKHVGGPWHVLTPRGGCSSRLAR